ncbi:hypothetical protein BJX63DRAFT_399460 [Aspergillus granulosus]|uniref:Uncharacterized protein n=1 Tax=Aspergillus granulosus TaxID=176169 RepID=A0ABR4H7F6_9EURO
MGDTALSTAERGGIQDAMRPHLGRSTDIESRNKYVATPLSLVAQRGNCHCCIAMSGVRRRGLNVDMKVWIRPCDEPYLQATSSGALKDISVNKWK